MNRHGAAPARSRTFRLITIAASGLGSFVLGIWGLNYGLGSTVAGLSIDGLGNVLAALCALAAAFAAASFFAGVNESASYVYQETQFDKLTGLLSRAALSDKIGEAASRSIRSGTPVFLIDIDIDRFKQINESIGYIQGDQLIRAFGGRLKELLPTGTEIGRLGAGEFGVLVPDTEEHIPVDRLVEDLIAKLSEPYHLPTHLQSVSMAVGVVALPKDGLDPLIVLRRSNLALQHARRSGIGNWAVFHRDMGLAAEYRHWIESELHLAFARGDFVIYYQPQCDLRNGRVVGYEALVRWRHPERGMIPPQDFVPVAEETGMIAAIGEWVLRRACFDAKSMPDDCFLAVNISPVQFMTKGFLIQVAQAIRESGIPSHRLELEITETAMMKDRETAQHILSELKRMGIAVAIDDFGTGYSNLSYLVDFPFSKLKIDQSFVRRLETDTNAAAVVSTIVGLARALGVRIIAEGVETLHQATLLQAAGCDIVQGYLYGKPVPMSTQMPSDPALQNRRAAQSNAA